MEEPTVNLQPLHDFFSELVGSAVGIILLFIAIAIWGPINRAKLRILGNKASWIGLIVFGGGLTLIGFALEQF